VDASAPLERIRGYIEAHRQNFATPGLALAVTDRERCVGVLVDGLAGVDAGEPVAPHHRFQIGSISKGFTALAILRHVERGAIDLDAAVADYLPWFEVQTSHAPITIHHLLSHTSGLVSGTDFTGNAASEVWSLRDTVTGFPPGERFLYSNVGYKTLGLLLEAVTGEPWWRTVHEEVMSPIGMGDADVTITNAVREHLAAGHRSPFDDRPWLPRHGWAPSPWFESGTADGTICATAEELTAYARVLLRSGRPLISAASFERMTTPYAEDPEAPENRFGYGVKWIEEDGRRPMLGHSGGMIGFSAYLLVDVEAGVGAAVLMNSAFGRRRDLIRFAIGCAAAEAGSDRLPEIPPAPGPAAIEGAASYVGAYRDDIGEVVVEPRGDGLVARTAGSTYALVEDYEGVLAVDDDELGMHPMRFDRRAGGTIVRWGSRELRDGDGPGTEADVPSDIRANLAGRYASWNPWAPGFRIFDRPSGLWLSFTGEALDVEPERRLEPVDDGYYRVGAEWSPDRVRFDMVVDGKAERAVYDGAPFYRTFVP
jgi:CubicO group peptidase (beta-lactamase class C family)